MERMKIGPSHVNSVRAGFRHNMPRLLFGIGLYIAVMAFTLACGELALVIRGETESATRYPLAPFLIPVSTLVVLFLIVLNWIHAKRDAWDWFSIGPSGITILRKSQAKSERVRLEISFEHVRILIFDRSFPNSLILSETSSAWCVIRYRNPNAATSLDHHVNFGVKNKNEILSISDAIRKYCPNAQIVYMPSTKWPPHR